MNRVDQRARDGESGREQKAAGEAMKVGFYGRLAEAIAPEIELETRNDCSIAELRDRLAEEYPQAARTLGSSRSRACVDGVMVGDDHVIRPADRVEFLPPVAGG